MQDPGPDPAQLPALSMSSHLSSGPVHARSETSLITQLLSDDGNTYGPEPRPFSAKAGLQSPVPGV